MALSHTFLSHITKFSLAPCKPTLPFAPNSVLVNAHDTRPSSDEAASTQEQNFVNRRKLFAWSASLAAFLLRATPECNAEDVSDMNVTLVPYMNPSLGVTLLKPESWKLVEKAGAALLFEDPQKRSNNLGLVINPVRVPSLTNFGNPDVVAQKLIQAERKKPTTNFAEILQVHERTINGNIPLYQFEYRVDGSRGTKRIYCDVSINDSKLYILNLTFADDLENPLSLDKAQSFWNILNSFQFL